MMLVMKFLLLLRRRQLVQVDSSNICFGPLPVSSAVLVDLCLAKGRSFPSSSEYCHERQQCEEFQASSL